MNYIVCGSNTSNESGKPITNNNNYSEIKFLKYDRTKKMYNFFLVLS